MRTIVCLAAATCFAAFAAASASAQDFNKGYELGAGGRITVTNMSGDVTVTGYDGNTVLVTGRRTGPDKDVVEIVDRSSGNDIEIGVKYPRNCNCDASVDFIVQVPRSTRYVFEKIASMSGDVRVEGVTGAVHATAMSGDVRVGVVDGTVEATAMSGDVEVDIDRLEGSGDLTFTSMSGNVELRLPSDVDAEVSIRTVSGDITTDFPIEVHEQKYGSGQWASGRLGDGSRRLSAKSMSGDVRLLRK
jgi:DUF4097 and DUF4098 domain-containing protein YvlB